MNSNNLINPIAFELPDKTPEEKEYLVLFYIDDDESGETIHHFESVIGRTQAYITIAQIIDMYGESVDLESSLVLVETKQTHTKTGNQIYFLSHPNDSHNLLKFIEFCQTGNNIPHEVLEKYRIDIEYTNAEQEYQIAKEPQKAEYYKAYMGENELYDNEMLTNNRHRSNEQDV